MERSKTFASWGATYPESLQSVKGSCAVIPCTFFFPSDVAIPPEGITSIWYKSHGGQRIVIYHSANPGTADAQFRDRTELVGDPLNRNCTLLLRKVTSQDSGDYNFRFEINSPKIPNVAAPEEIREGLPVTFNCSSPYVCPYDGGSTLRWVGYIAETSLVSETVQLDPTGVLRKQLLQTSLTWKDHNQKLTYAPKGVTVSLNPSTKNIRVGDAAKLTCNVNSSYPEVTAYRWFKDGVACGNTLVKAFQSVARGDYGLYHCEADNSVGTGTSEGVTLYVFYKQEIHYSWYKNNLWIKEGTARSLFFQEVAVGDTGYYSCKVRNDKGSEMSPAVGLIVLYPPRIPSLALYQETQEGRSAIVHCTVDSNPPSALTLYRDKHLLATTDSHLAPSQRITITTTRNSLKLEIWKVVPEDEGDYKCVATNLYGRTTVVRFFGAQTARVVVQPSNELPEGTQVTLTCIATLGSGEETMYTWYKNGKWLQAGKENSLVFLAVTNGDAGVFHCAAQNEGGINTSPPVALRPVMRSFLESQGGHLGIIQCTVDSDPPSEVALYKGDVLIGSTNITHSGDDPRVSMTSSYNALKVSIKDVGLEDEGTYVCSAQNRYGEATASKDFVAETARIIVTPSSELLEGEAVHLSCSLRISNSSASSNYTWYKDGLPLLETLGDLVEFQHVARKDAGTYYCQVETPTASKSSAPIVLSVLYPPVDLQVAIFLETERGRVAIFQISVDSKPPAQFVLSKGDKVMASSSLKTSTTLERISITSGQNAMRVEMRGVVPEDEGSYNITATNAYVARVLVTPSPEVLEGEAVSLTCDVMGNVPDDSTFSWYKNSKRVQRSHDGGTLTFLHITSEEAGSYFCKVHTPDETGISISPSVSITVFYPPRKPQMTFFLQTEGKSVAVLQCTVESEPQAHLEISKGRVVLASSISSRPVHNPRIKSSATYNSLRVEIWDVVMEDEGEYVCSASNTYGNVSSKVKFTANAARIWITPPDVLEGHSANLTCAVDSEATSELHYTWYKNNQWWAEGPSKILVLPHVTVADAGTYYCTVKTQERVRNSSLGTLNVLYPPRNALVKSFLETQKGKLAIIVCTVESNPVSMLSLCRANQVLAASSSQVNRVRVPDHKLKSASSPNSLRLEIKDVSPDDEGTYECVASNGIGQTSTSLDFMVETTRVVIQPTSDVHEGDHVSLTCEDTASPSNALYTWYKNAKWLSQDSAPSLQFHAVSASDMGTYSCQVRSEKGIRTSPPAALHVLYAPKKPSLTSFLETQSGNQAVIQCKVESYPPSDMTLSREDTIVASSRTSGGLPDPRLSIRSAQNSLKVEIQEVLLQDEGHYRCLANNTYGSSTASIYFSVESARITIDPAPDVQEGASANLTCVIARRAAGEMNYTWYKNGRHIRGGPDPSLLLEGLAREEAGSYQCQAEGMMGHPPKDPIMSAYLDNQNGKVGIISCQVDSHPRSRLALYKGGRLVASTNGSRSTAGRRFIVFSSYNSLRVEIRDIVAGDSGHYMCQVGNQLGDAASAIDFRAESE
ncbi:hypothetical protein JD844_026033 [Phrynosoma platyrhinos]|uniref:Ig-like domain-containing protein n=1 Tax=Phrynosoma platyrhinos TaxID=52577 RepID=A0ABQ7SEE6_PHRPL|nr:hypothetical protein JD844_026033 [Phrynosoma platyrhinos]